MSFRTSSTTQQRQNLLDLQATQERLALNQSRIASGKRITQPGEDPAGAALILDFGTSIDTNTQFLKQVDSASSFLQYAEDAVATTINDTTRLQELAQQGLSSTNAGSGRAALAQEVAAIRANLLAMGNTQVQGKYIFAGTMTTTPPFADDGTGTGTLAYNGDNSTINLTVSAGSAPVATNVTGRQVFQGGAPAAGSATDIFQVTLDLQAALATNNEAAIQLASTRLQTIQDNLNQVQADLGGRQAGLADVKSTLTSFNATLQGMQSGQEDTDFAQAITQYSSDQTIQSATLSIMAKTSKVNLFDYLA